MQSKVLPFGEDLGEAFSPYIFSPQIPPQAKSIYYFSFNYKRAA
jgi:hypothetical protein